MRRFHVLVLGSLVISGTAQDAVGVESFLERTVQRSGATLSHPPRIGLGNGRPQLAPALHAGSYNEPTRFPSNKDGAESTPRSVSTRNCSLSTYSAYFTKATGVPAARWTPLATTSAGPSRSSLALNKLTLGALLLLSSACAKKEVKPLHTEPWLAIHQPAQRQAATQGCPQRATRSPSKVRSTSSCPYLGRGGYYPAALERIAERYPIVTHGLTLSIGAVDEPEPGYLGPLKAELRAPESAPRHSDHLCFSTAGERVLHELLPLDAARKTRVASPRALRRIRRAWASPSRSRTSPTTCIPGNRS